jgi:hypothetical protein
MLDWVRSDPAFGNYQRGQKGQHGSLTTVLEDREQQNSLTYIHHRVQQHHKDSDDKDGLM